MNQPKHTNLKPVIIMQPGPPHLFWTTSIFYLWLLKERFDFVLIVPEPYQGSPQFSKVASLEAIRHVEFIPTKGKLLRHFKYSTRFQTLLRQYQPAYLLVHNQSYDENQYLNHWAKKNCPETIRYYYQLGRCSLMWQNDFDARRAIQIEALIKKIPLLSRNLKLAGKVLDLRNGLSFVLNYKVFPWLVLQTTFNPPVNVWNGHIDRESTRQMTNTDKDFLLAYLDNEIEFYHSQGNENIVQIRHPLTECGTEVFKFLYGEFTESDTILILPSYGFTSQMIEDGWLQADLIRHIAGKWGEAIEKLLERFPGFGLKMKLHPSSTADPFWQETVQQIQSRFPTLIIVDPGQSAEWHIVQSKVIVGDVSSVLWWAGIYGGKVVVSLDIFGYHGGDELKKYPDIIQAYDQLNDLPDSIMSEICRVPVTYQGLASIFYRK